MKNTPVIYIKSLSKITGYNIYAKCEYFNYYTSKDRIFKKIFLDAKNKNLLNKDNRFMKVVQDYLDIVRPL